MDLRTLPDFPQPPTNLQLFEEVPNTVTLTWNHSPDVQEDSEAHYVIMKRDVSTAIWFTVAEHVFSNKYTVTGLLPGRKYYFRVLARNEISDGDPLDSRDTWLVNKDKSESGDLGVQVTSVIPDGGDEIRVARGTQDLR
ncbi:immunoglobulin-like and fibronectin type III domain-containing protein 1 [Physeter macrocephalus]|uniref:immunoglobulin-like and fibronectin type III domain-containing protein 1 n=1 Tax=Physeter macrocephalus TaxID=9755 RepID=UPI0024331C34|nr:immunoglobulin-like and fibronectin type III domain-containing protein 1 [Physeter catodon]